MRRTLVVGLVSLLVCGAWAPSGHASWWVRTPFVTVSGGPGVSVQAPYVDIHVGRVAAPIPPPGPVVVRVLTLEEFAASFRPAPGNYEVTIRHTRSGCPVTVCFTLPPGCPKVCLHRHQLDFDYPCQNVRVRFQLGGKVKVTYH